ncbi:hypothetical protein [Rhizobium phaseoli]|uniref:hypothetical protein n=1 Tax=Rhizobium phaseoli TaxID=396 RepID=UPI000BBB07B7|nr:hypothetical protein [Rhizobium phaseoli]PCD64969.1 hypothetical protein CO648_25580 [Rhizobium phaseoli]
MQEQWGRWGWIIALVVIVMGFLRLLYGREPFCASGPDEHCLREWTSALGGWAAVAAAIPTVWFLSRQVRDAEKHHRTTVGIQTRPTYMLAKKAAETSANIKAQCEETLARWQSAKLPSTLSSLREAVERLKFLRSLADRTEFARVQTEIEFTHMRHEQLIDSISVAIQDVERDLEELTVERVPIAREAVIESHKNAIMYLQQIQDVCSRFIIDFDRMTEHLR